MKRTVRLFEKRSMLITTLMTVMLVSATTTRAQSSGTTIDVNDNSPPNGTGWTYNSSQTYTVTGDHAAGGGALITTLSLMHLLLDKKNHMQIYLNYSENYIDFHFEAIFHKHKSKVDIL
jgi:hypothetical protein